jgi:hypothetical protein
MYSNFITPPDYVKNLVIVDATDQQIQACMERVKSLNTAYNIYVYNQSMNDQTWFDQVASRADSVIYADKNDPLEYFDK